MTIIHNIKVSNGLIIVLPHIVLYYATNQLEN